MKYNLIFFLSLTIPSFTLNHNVFICNERVVFIIQSISFPPNNRRNPYPDAKNPVRIRHPKINTRYHQPGRPAQWLLSIPLAPYIWCRQLVSLSLIWLTFSSSFFFSLLGFLLSSHHNSDSHAQTRPVDLRFPMAFRLNESCHFQISFGTNVFMLINSILKY